MHCCRSQPCTLSHISLSCPAGFSRNIGCSRKKTCATSTSATSFFLLTDFNNLLFFHRIRNDQPKYPKKTPPPHLNSVAALPCKVHFVKRRKGHAIGQTWDKRGTRLFTVLARDAMRKRGLCCRTASICLSVCTDTVTIEH